MKFQNFSASKFLAPYVKAFLIIESDVEEFTNTLPGTSIVMAFRYRGNVSSRDGNKSETLPASAASGLRKTSRQFNYAAKSANLLVIFNEGGLAAFSKIPAHELFTISTSTDNIFPVDEVEEVLELLSQANSDKIRIKIIETFLIGKLHERKHDPLVAHAIEIIKQQNGIVRIKALAETLNISQDPFEKRFRAIVGATPKQFASIVRLRYLIRNYPSYASLTEASYQAGYFDQSHFIKDFRMFTGKSPREFLKNSNFW